MASQSDNSAPRLPLARTLRALRNRNYRLFFFGQGASMIGTWMQGVTLSWLVYVLTASKTWLGVIGFAGQAPTFLLSPFAGVLADRLSKHRLVQVTQTLAMIQAFVLALLALTGWIQVWHILVLAILLGFVSSFDIPIRQSFVVEMVEDRQDLPNAIALNSFLVNGGRIVGPSIAGLLIAALSGYDIQAGEGGAPVKHAGGFLGEGVCFLFNGVSYLGVLAALRAMRISPRANARPRRHVLHELREGFRYAFGSSAIRSILLMLALVSLMGSSYGLLMPVFAKDILAGDARTYGFLMSSAGVGAMAGAVFLASRRNVLGLERLIALATGLFGASLIGFSQSGALWLSLGLLLCTGFGFMVTMASCNTILQTIVDDDKRGRVMSFYTLSFMGMAPFGNLLAGLLARPPLGAPGVLVVTGSCLILGAIVFGLRLPGMRRQVRPIYVRMGILPEVEPGDPVSHQVVPPLEP